MKSKKSLPTLLGDLFAFFQEKYGNHEAYESFADGEPDRYKVVSLTVPDCPNSALPGLVLKHGGGDSGPAELMLTSIVPIRGKNDYFHGKLIGIFCESDVPKLWMSPSDSFGSANEIIRFDEEEKTLSLLRLELIAKVHELFYSGAYELRQKNLVS